MLQEQLGVEHVPNFENGFAPPEVVYINQIEELIDVHFKWHKDQDFCTKQMCLSIKMINAMLKYCMGKTFHEMIQHRLHRKTSNLFIHTLMSMQEIAFEFELSEPAYFSRWFKSISVMKPRKYRDTYQSKKLYK